MSKAGNIRIFICIELPGTVQALFAEIQASLKEIGADVSWVKPSNIHLTLKFLGDVPEQKVPVIWAAVEKAALAVSAMEIQVRGAGCFPTARNPRVLWVGIQPVPSPLRELQELIDVGLSTKGYTREDRPFSPHLTIGRVKSPQNLQALIRKLQALDFESKIVTVREVTVMRSDLKPTGALYTPIRVFPLVGKSGHN